MNINTNTNLKINININANINKYKYKDRSRNYEHRLVLCYLVSFHLFSPLPDTQSTAVTTDNSRNTDI